MHDESITRNKGFSLLELTCAMAILLVVGGAALYGLAVYQRSYSGTSLRQNMQSSVRTATELLQQEIGQAGAFTGLGGNPSVTIAATISTGVQNVTLPAGYTSNMWVGEKLQVDLGANQETVAITAISGNVITATFTNSHPAPGNANTVISFAGIFPNGILSTSDGTHLYIIGDVNGDGNLYYVAYTCTQSNTPPNYGTLMRSITLLPNNTAAQADTLVQNVTLNPDASACFSYQPTASITVSGTTYTFIPGVGLTLSTASSQMDPTMPGCGGVTTGTYPTCYITVTNSFLNLSPRNILFGKTLASAQSTKLLQPLPPSGSYRP